MKNYKTKDIVLSSIIISTIAVSLAWLGIKVPEKELGGVVVTDGIITASNDSGYYDDSDHTYLSHTSIPNPQIGDSKGTAEGSAWGQPSSKKMLSTPYGEVEYWYYDNGKMLYFRDGKLDTVVDNEEA